MARKTSNPLTQPIEIAANRRGQITKRQQSRLGGAIWQKRQRWLGFVLASLLPTFGPFIGFLVAAFRGYDRWAIGLLCISIALFCLWLMPATWIYLRWRRLGRNLAREPVAQGEGTVSWQRSQYVFVLDDGGRRLDPACTHGLFPGRYRLYYLPRRRWLLTAEPLDGALQADDLQQLTLHLARVNRFQPGALDANRSGRLTGAQKVRLLGRLALSAAAGSVAAVLCVVYLGRETGLFGSLWFLIALIAVVAVLMFLVLRPSLRLLADCRRGQVLVAEGAATKDEEADVEGSVTYYYDLNRHSFKVNESGYYALIEGLTYRLYYLPRSKKLVNVEAVAAEIAAS
jgi:hypothetical protein